MTRNRLPGNYDPLKNADRLALTTVPQQAVRPQARYPPSHGIPLGYMPDPYGEKHWLYYNHTKPKSLITIAPSGTGKTLTQLAYELGVYGGMIDGVAPSIAANDKKGELLRVAGRARFMLGDTVFKVDPHGVVPPLPYVTDARLNVLEGLTPRDTTDLLNIATGVLIMQGNDPHWIDRPRTLASGVMAYLVDDNEEPATLPRLYDILSKPDIEVKAFLSVVAEHSPVPFVRQSLAPFGADTDEVSSVISSTLGQLGFLADENIARVLNGPSSFRWSDMKRGGMSIFFCMPEKLAETGSRFTRLFWTSAINAVYESPYHPILMIIDEAANSLHATSQLFETAFALGRGFGLRLHLLFQNLPQLYGLFKEQSESIMSSAGVTQWYRPNDITTAKYIMERAGNITFPVHKANHAFSTTEGMNDSGRKNLSFNTSTSYSTDYYDRPRWTAQQLFEMSTHRQLLFFEGMGAPLAAWRLPYPLSPWASRFDDNPYVVKKRS